MPLFVFIVDAEYEKWPLFYSNCKILSHNLSNCRHLQHDANVISSREKTIGAKTQ